MIGGACGGYKRKRAIPFLSPGRRMYRRRFTPSVDHAGGPNVTVSW